MATGTPASTPSTARGVIASKNTTINEYGTHYDATPLQSLQKLKDWAEDRDHNRIHHIKIVGKVSKLQIDQYWLKNIGYRFSKGSGKSNIAQYTKTWVWPGLKIDHLIHLNGTWVISITPKVTQRDPQWVIRCASDVLDAAFRGAHYFHVVVKQFESSRPDSELVLKWLKENNIKEIKTYIHDNYESRVEITYLNTALSPRTSRILAELG
jgi:hypothetical protein